MKLNRIKLRNRWNSQSKRILVKKIIKDCDNTAQTEEDSGELRGQSDRYDYALTTCFYGEFMNLARTHKKNTVIGNFVWSKIYLMMSGTFFQSQNEKKIVPMEIVN